MTSAELSHATWRGRAVGEQKAAWRFACLAGALDDHGLPRLAALARRGVADELRHVDLCLALAGATHLPDRARAVDRWSRRRLLGEAVAFCCVTETLNTALLATGLERANDTASAATLRQILRDEVTHARLGWAVLGSFSPQEVEAAGLDLAALLRRTVSADVFDDTAELAPGEPTRAERRAVISSTVREVVIPGLAQGGLDVRSAERWLTAFDAGRPEVVHGAGPA